MKIVIRTDASIQIGSGHVMRCLTLAKQLKEKNLELLFWMEPLEGNLIDFVQKQEFGVTSRSCRGDLLIIDHYGLDQAWEKSQRVNFNKILVIDDLAREHACDLLLDQNMLPNYKERYEGKVPNHCKKLLGIQYLLLRDEFIEARKKLKQRNNKVERLLVFMGGTDPTRETIKVLEALKDFQFPIVDVVVGENNPLKNQIKEICEGRNYFFHCQIDYIAELMMQADFSIGAGGSTVWERAYLGLPSSATIVADNQYTSTKYIAELGLINYLGWHEEVTIDTYKQLLLNLTIEQMSNKCLELTNSVDRNLLVTEILEMMK